MHIPKSILLLSFALQASFAPSVGARRLKSSGSSKSAKSAKHPKPVCLQEGFQIEPPEFAGDTDGVYNYQDFCKTCCDPLCANLDTSTGSDVSTDYCGFVSKTYTFEPECLDSFSSGYPFSFENYDTALSMDGVKFSFTDEESFIGDTSFKGEIDSPDNGAKVILKYLSEPFDPAEFNGNLVGRPLSSLDYIEYSFKASSCQGAATECPGQFYLNVYTKDPTDASNWYNCRFDFRPVVGADATTGDWTTVRFDKDSVPTGGDNKGDSGSICPQCGDIGGSACTVTMGALASSSNLVLGATDNRIFSLNMGDSLPNDAGLKGYYDRIVVKLGHEENPRVYDL